LDGISISRTPSFDCPSGICTWSEYQSFGVCSSCKDVSKQAEKNCHSADRNGFDTFFCDYLIGEDISIRREVSFTDDSAHGTVGTLLSITMDSTMARLDRSIVFARPGPSIIRFGILRVEADEYIPRREHLKAYEDVHETLYECELSWCLKQYGPAKIDNGILKESAPTQSTFLNKTHFFKRSCVGVEDEVSFYKVFRLQDDVGHSNDTNQYRRLADAFRGCPDIATMSKDENVYVVNAVDEVGIR
jgi:hypothetical protein